MQAGANLCRCIGKRRSRPLRERPSRRSERRMSTWAGFWDRGAGLRTLWGRTTTPTPRTECVKRRSNWQGGVLRTILRETTMDGASRILFRCRLLLCVWWKIDRRADGTPMLKEFDMLICSFASGIRLNCNHAVRMLSAIIPMLFGHLKPPGPSICLHRTDDAPIKQAITATFRARSQVKARS